MNKQLNYVQVGEPQKGIKSKTTWASTKQLGHDDLKDWKLHVRMIVEKDEFPIIEMFIEKILSQQHQLSVTETIEKVKEMIGEDEYNFHPSNKKIANGRLANRNRLRRELRQQLSQLNIKQGNK